MRLFVEHWTEYSYSSPAQTSIQYVRLSPRLDPVQKVLDWQVEAEGRSTIWRDGFGNIVHTLVNDAAHGNLRIHVSGEVDTQETHGVVPLDDSEPPPDIFLRPTPLTLADAGLRDLAGGLSGLLAKKGQLAALHALMGEIHERVEYRTDSTDVATDAATAFAKGAGLCQDHAHIFIAACRSLGIPARYVSGYLHTSAEDGRHLATHAWAEAMVDYLGWVSFDPSNRQSATQAYIRLAVGMDYTGAAPVTGIRLGGGHEEMSVTVQVAEQ